MRKLVGKETKKALDQILCRSSCASGRICVSQTSKENKKNNSWSVLSMLV